jgi:transposase
VAFQATYRDQLRTACRTNDYRWVKVFAQDESRVGLLTVARRRLTARGVQPVGLIQHTFQSFYVYGAVAPTTGEHVFLQRPGLNSTNFQLFVDALAQAYPDTLNVLVLDNSGAHTAKRLTLPDNIRLVLLPPYTPELNPMERVWRDLKDELAWMHFADLEAQQAHVANILQTYAAATLQSLTAYAYFVEAVNALST